MHELSVRAMEPGDSIENIPPEIIIVSLFDDPVVFAKGEFCTPKHGRAGKFLEHHGHFPFKEDLVFALCDGRNIHPQLFTTLRQPIAQCNKIFFALYRLNTILKNDILVVIRENM
jgi:hypothetical protein